MNRLHVNPEKVRRALAEGAGTMEEIAKRADLPIEVVRPVVWNMTRNGTVVLEKSYRLAKP